MKRGIAIRLRHNPAGDKEPATIEYAVALPSVMAKPFKVEKAGILSVLMAIAGAAIAAVSALDVAHVAFEDLGGAGWITLLVGVGLLIIGGLWAAMYRGSVRRFNKLMEEQSRAAFVRSMDDVEFLAWKLPMKYENQLMDKKRKLGIR